MTAFLLLLYSSHCFICGHVHDELIIECSQDVDYCNVMGGSPDWMPDILIRGGGYETAFYKKE
jgi:DNA polymerase